MHFDLSEIDSNRKNKKWKKVENHPNYEEHIQNKNKIIQNNKLANFFLL